MNKLVKTKVAILRDKYFEQRRLFNQAVESFGFTPTESRTAEVSKTANSALAAYNEWQEEVIRVKGVLAR